jgi:hypothetical protein
MSKNNVPNSLPPDPANDELLKRQQVFFLGSWRCPSLVDPIKPDMAIPRLSGSCCRLSFEPQNSKCRTAILGAAHEDQRHHKLVRALVNPSRHYGRNSNRCGRCACWSVAMGYFNHKPCRGVFRRKIFRLDQSAGSGVRPSSRISNAKLWAQTKRSHGCRD